MLAAVAAVSLAHAPLGLYGLHGVTVASRNSHDKHWPVDVAYFDVSGGDEIPTYRISFKLHRNGLTRDLVMDYGDFAINGRLVELEFREADAADCPD